MPTVKPRYTFTDSGKLSQMLDQAGRRWPDVSERKQLLILLAEAGSEAIGSEVEARREAVRSSAGALTGLYEPDELSRLREDWPD